MVVMIFDKTTPAIRGKLSMWFLEIKTGVFVGHVSAMVRDKLWDWVTSQPKLGGCIQVYASNTEQHFAIRQAGATSRQILHEEGLYLVAKMND